MLWKAGLEGWAAEKWMKDEVYLLIGCFRRVYCSRCKPEAITSMTTTWRGRGGKTGGGGRDKWGAGGGRQGVQGRGGGGGSGRGGESQWEDVNSLKMWCRHRELEEKKKRRNWRWLGGGSQEEEEYWKEEEDNWRIRLTPKVYRCQILDSRGGIGAGGSERREDEIDWKQEGGRGLMSCPGRRYISAHKSNYRQLAGGRFPFLQLLLKVSQISCHFLSSDSITLETVVFCVLATFVTFV